MGWFVSDERVAVEGLECRCPGTPHPDGDTVWLRAELGPDAGFAVLRLIREATLENDSDAVQERIGRIYATHGIVDWTFLDEAGEVIPATPANIARLSWDVLLPVAEKGDNLYAEALLRPLVARVSKSSRNGHTAPSTSARRRASSTPSRRSRPSTTATTRARP